MNARQTVFECMELLPQALVPFVEARLSQSISGHWRPVVARKIRGVRPVAGGDIAWDQATLLKAMVIYWHEAFAAVLPQAARAYASELLDVRNRLAHFEPFSEDDAERALDTMRRLAAAIGDRDLGAQLERRRLASFLNAERREDASLTSMPAAESTVSRRHQPASEPMITQAERIRRFVIDRYAAPARTAGKAGFTVRAGDVHRSMGLSNAMPNVCSALGGKLFENAAGVRLKKRHGPPAGSTVTFEFLFD